MLYDYMIMDGCRLDKEEFCPIPQDVNPEDHFEYVRLEDIFILWFILFLSLLFKSYIFKYLEKIWCFKEFLRNFYPLESILFSIFVLLWSYITYIQNEQAICSFPRWCTEGENNTLVTENYYYKMDTCPKEYAWLTYLYEETNPSNFDDDCKNTEYGCCSLISNRCADSLRTEDSFSLYLEVETRNISHWHLNIMKLDEEGSNCPTIEEILYEVSENSQTDYYEKYITFYLVHTGFILVLFIVTHSFYDNEKCKTYINKNDEGYMWTRGNSHIELEETDSLKMNV